MLAKPFCDWLTVSHDMYDQPALVDRVRFALVETPYVMTHIDGSIYKYGTSQCTGLVRFGSQGRVGTLSVSGVALTAIRGAGAFDSLLQAIMETQHNVTRLDAALDEPRADAPRVVVDLYSRGRTTGVYISRKQCALENVRKWLGPAAYDPSVDTGTVQFGNRGQTRTIVRIYDKQHEQLSKGQADPGPLLRWEVECHKSGATLRDAHSPEQFFWHNMRDLLQKPDDVADWVPGPGQRFELTPLPERTAVDRLKRFIEAQGGTFRELLRLADATVTSGSHGRSYAWSLLQRLGRPEVAPPVSGNAKPSEAA